MSNTARNELHNFFTDCYQLNDGPYKVLGSGCSVDREMFPEGQSMLIRVKVHCRGPATSSVQNVTTVKNETTAHYKISAQRTASLEDN